jgi:hypothetical protein
MRMFRFCPLLALIVLAAIPAAAQTQIARVQIFTDLNTQGLDTAFMDRPTWGVIKARVIRTNGQTDLSTAVAWRTLDSTKVRLRLRKTQSVAIESPLSAGLGRTRVIADVAGHRDTISVVVRNGLTGVGLAPGSSKLAPKSTEQLCAWMVTRSGGRILTAKSAAIPYCVQQYPNR